MWRYWVVYSLTFSRIPLAMLFIVFFQPKKTYVIISTSILLISYFTDVMDGYLARKFRIASISGLFFDGLADKSIYISTIVAFNAQGILPSIMAWGLIFSEITLYIHRIMNYEKINLLSGMKIYSRIYGFPAQMLMFSGVVSLYFRVLNYDTYFTYIPMYFAVATFLTRIVSIIAFQLKKPSL